MKTTIFAASAALLALSACSQPNQDAAESAANAAAAQNELVAATVDMPPPIKTQKVYRCASGDVIYVGFAEGDTQAQLREGSNSAPATTLKAAKAGDPFEGESGYALTGTGDSVSITRPGKPAETCKA